MSASGTVLYDGAGNAVDSTAALLARMESNLLRQEKITPEEVTRRLNVLKGIEGRQFDPTNPPTEPKPRFTLIGRPICTPGNLTALISQAKTGKSAFTGAMMAAWMARGEDTRDLDLLGLAADRDAAGMFVHVDTEQSRFDHFQLIQRAARRAGRDAVPDSLISYGLAGIPAHEMRDVFRALLWQYRLEGVFAAIIDGVADLCADVNDAEEVNGLVAELHGWAIQYDCPIICVVHENPTHDTGKARGHLGSQLERKCESNLRLKKIEETTVVYSEKMRRAPILEREGPRFRWSDEAGMHVSVETVGYARDEAKRSELMELAQEVFESSPRLRFADIVGGIVKARDCSKRTAERQMAAMREHKVIKAEGFGFYAPTTDKQPTN